MTPSNNRKHKAQQKTRPQGSNPGTPTERTVHDNFMVLESYAKNKTPTRSSITTIKETNIHSMFGSKDPYLVLTKQQYHFVL